ncbi:hypothetical protein AVEN_103632-1 [Araneus ventricosus]|uniref:Uncharacterized protein n=1 Tax=Araneus ventricosus TaxID=182803 RepID=A0A4Y2HBH7_ARAVE|nr:hypothetical protein AVEN_103632-1 [Araneus ventricosus]
MTARMPMMRKETSDLVITENLVQKVDGKLLENRRFTISSLSNEFSQVSRSAIYGIVSERLNYLRCAHYGQAENFYEIVGYDKCLNICGNYLEK